LSPSPPSLHQEVARLTKDGDDPAKAARVALAAAAANATENAAAVTASQAELKALLAAAESAATTAAGTESFEAQVPRVERRDLWIRERSQYRRRRKYRLF